MNKLIINSDDFGYSRGINHAIIDTYQKGILSSTTLMTNTPGFEHAVALAKNNKNLGVGVHLVLTFLKPLRDDLPSLVDEEGNFYRPKDYVTENHQVEAEELYKEWDAQIKKVIAAGIVPTHLDSHHHIHSINDIHLDVFFRLAKKYNLPVRKAAEDDQIVENIKMPSCFEDSFDKITSLTDKDAESYLNDLYRRIKTHDSTELMCHAGYIDEFLISSSSFTTSRVKQVKILSDSKFVDKIRADQNIHLSTFADL